MVNPFYSRSTLVSSMQSGFYSGLTCPSTLFERHRRFTSPSKRAADSQNFWCLSNTDAPVYVYQQAIVPVLRWRSSKREKKLLNRLAVSSFFQNFWRVDHRSPTDLSDIPTDRRHTCMRTLHMTCQTGQWERFRDSHFTDRITYRQSVKLIRNLEFRASSAQLYVYVWRTPW